MMILEQQELILKTRNLKIVKIMIMIMNIIAKKTIIMQKIGLGSNLSTQMILGMNGLL